MCALSSFSPCGQSDHLQKNTDFQTLSWWANLGRRGFPQLNTLIQNRQRQQVLEIWRKRARELWPGKAGWDLQTVWKHFQGIRLPAILLTALEISSSNTLLLEFRWQRMELPHPCWCTFLMRFSLWYHHTGWGCAFGKLYKLFIFRMKDAVHREN